MTTLRLNATYPGSGETAWGTRFTVATDRDVATKQVGGQLTPMLSGVREYTLTKGMPLPEIEVIPNDAPELQEWSTGYALIVECEPTPAGGVTGGPWTITIDSTTSDPVDLNELDFHNVVSLPPNLNLGDTMSRLTTVEGVAGDAKTIAGQANTKADGATATAQQALDTAKAAVAPSDQQIGTLLPQKGSQANTGLDTAASALAGDGATKLGAALNDIVKPRTPGSTAGATLNTTLLQRIRGHAGILTTEWGAKADGGSAAPFDNADVLQGLVNAAASTATPLVFAPGVYGVGGQGLSLPSGTVIRPQGFATGRFWRPATYNNNFGTVALRFTAPQTAPLIKAENVGGLDIDGLVLVGSNATGGAYPLLDAWMNFESRWRNVRIISHTTNPTALRMLAFQNSVVENFFVDNCGQDTASASAVVLGSTAFDMSGNAVSNWVWNTATLRNIHIERCSGPSLDIGWGSDSGSAYAEFIKLYDLHIESGNDANGPVPPNYPTLRIGNVAAATLVAPMLYQGDGGDSRPCIVVNRQNTRGVSGSGGSADSSGRVTILGGSLLGAAADASALGSNATVGQKMTASTYAVDLISGNGFSMFGTEVNRFTTAIANIRPSFGRDVRIQSPSSPQLPALLDARATNAGSIPPIERVQRQLKSTTASVTYADATTKVVATMDPIKVAFPGMAKIVLNGDLAYNTAGDTLVIQVFINGTKLTSSGDLVFSSGSTGRSPIEKTWYWTIPNGIPTSDQTIELRTFRYSGTGTNSVLNVGASVEIEYLAKP